jgi:hypothetical protein
MTSALYVDENIYFNSNVQTESNYMLCYFDVNNNFHWKSGNSLPYWVGQNNRIMYDPVGATLTEVPDNNNQYINYYVVLINAYNAAQRVLILPGQSIFGSLTSAQVDGVSNLDLSSLPFQEFNFIYQRTYRIGQGYSTTTGKTRLEAPPVKLGLTSAQLIGVNSIHNNLAGRSDLNCHPGSAILLTTVGNSTATDLQSFASEVWGKFYSTRFATTTNTYYIGTAAQGSLDSATVWKIRKVVVNSDGTNTITTATNVAWTDYLTATYS